MKRFRIRSIGGVLRTMADSNGPWVRYIHASQQECQINTLNKQIKLMAKLIVDCIGTCPMDHDDLTWEHPEGGCEKRCEAKGESIEEMMIQCWALYYHEMAKKE
jgi:hypothetical protein